MLQKTAYFYKVSNSEVIQFKVMFFYIIYIYINESNTSHVATYLSEFKVRFLVIMKNVCIVKKKFSFETSI